MAQPGDASLREKAVAEESNSKLEVSLDHTTVEMEKILDESGSTTVEIDRVAEDGGAVEEESVDKEGRETDREFEAVPLQKDEEEGDSKRSESNKEEESKSGESTGESVQDQEGLELDAVSTNVVIEGLVQKSAEGVDLERLKPKVCPETRPKNSVLPPQSSNCTLCASSARFAENEPAVESELLSPIDVDNVELVETGSELSIEAGGSLSQQRNESDSKEEDQTNNSDSSKMQTDDRSELALRETERRVKTDKDADSSALGATKASSAQAASPSNPRPSTRAVSLPPTARLSTSAYSSLSNTLLEESVAPDASPINWEKPAWTKVKLKSTEAGAIVKQGASLQAPITHIREFVSPAPITSGLSRRRASLPTGTSIGIGAKVDWERPAWTRPQLKATKAGEVVKSGGSLDAPDSPIKGAERKTVQWTKPTWVKPKLRSTDGGVVAKTKGDLQKPITNVEKKVSDSINLEANPMELRSTGTGYEIRLGASLAAPITHVKRNPMADVNFEANPEFVLQPSEAGQAVKQGSTLSKPVTHVNAEKDITRDVNFVAKPASLRKTDLGKIAKDVGDLQGPITHVERDVMKDINLEANPLALKPTEKGFKIRLGDDLSGPITSAPKLKNRMADVNFEANPDLILQPTEQGQAAKQGTSLSKAITHVNTQKDVARDLNFVANPAKLRRTELGELAKTKGDLQKPITHVEKGSMDDINFEANPMVLRPTTKGSLLRIGEDLARPITHIARNRTTDGNENTG